MGKRDSIVTRGNYEHRTPNGTPKAGPDRPIDIDVKPVHRVTDRLQTPEMNVGLLPPSGEPEHMGLIVFIVAMLLATSAIGGLFYIWVNRTPQAQNEK